MELQFSLPPGWTCPVPDSINIQVHQAPVKIVIKGLGQQVYLVPETGHVGPLQGCDDHSLRKVTENLYHTGQQRNGWEGLEIQTFPG